MNENDNSTSQVLSLDDRQLYAAGQTIPIEFYGRYFAVVESGSPVLITAYGKNGSREEFRRGKSSVQPFDFIRLEVTNGSTEQEIAISVSQLPIVLPADVNTDGAVAVVGTGENQELKTTEIAAAGYRPFVPVVVEANSYARIAAANGNRGVVSFSLKDDAAGPLHVTDETGGELGDLIRIGASAALPVIGEVWAFNPSATAVTVYGGEYLNVIT